MNKKINKNRLVMDTLCWFLFNVSAFAATAAVNADQTKEIDICKNVSESVHRAASELNKEEAADEEEGPGRNRQIESFTLSNGIPVYYIENNDNKVDVVSIVVKGGRGYLKPEQSGLEKTLFKMMACDSSKYGFQKRQQLAYEKRIKIEEKAMNNATVLSLNCLNYYLDEMIPVLADGFINPAYHKPVYDYVMSLLRQDVQKLQSEPVSILSYNIQKEAYKNHPYQAFPEPTPESLSNLTIDAMKKWHKTVLDSRRISIVAVTSMDSEKLLAKLETYFGKIKAQNTDLPELKSQPFTISGDPLVLTSSSAAGSGYAVRAFRLPFNSHSDFITASLAANIFGTTMWNIIRTKYGACYVADSEIVDGIGFDGCYMISNLKDFTNYVKEAREIMAKGKYVVKINDDGSYEFSSVEAVLPGAKNVLINRIYGSTIKTSGRAALYVQALVDYNDIMAFDSMIKKIDTVTAQEVVQVFNKYWVEQPSRWFAVVGPEAIDEVSFEE